MTVKWSATVRNALLDAWEAAIGASAIVQIRTGPAPLNCAAADTGTLLVEFVLGADWASPAASGVKSLSGLPLTEEAVATGTAGHYRIKNSAGTTCHEQGTVSSTGGPGDMILDDATIDVGQEVQIVAWSKTAPGA